MLWFSGQNLPLNGGENRSKRQLVALAMYLHFWVVTQKWWKMGWYVKQNIFCFMWFPGIVQILWAVEHQTGTDSWLGINSNGQELDHYGNKKYKNTKHKQEPFWKCILKPTKRRRIHQFEHSDKCCWNAKINWHWHHVNLCLEWS